MNNIARLLCLIGILSLTACGGVEDDHTPDEDSAAHSHDGDEAHEHGDADHAHEAPATEAYYGEEAEADEETHSHGDEDPHTHDH